MQDDPSGGGPCSVFECLRLPRGSDLCIGADVQLVVRVAVAQRDSAQLHMPAAGWQRRRAWRVGERRLAVEHLEDARAGGGCALGEVQGDTERAQRADEHVEQ